ncbi:class I SAM-dependent methyltransferase [Falsirhodobacter sp. alg1]|uniref:class I SAM-dependent methyltransferase n=1 Tax=Falsirhodobacter sp. alg1 TaxID=1472418 RepID=UPI0005EF3AAE|nr:SAM-dependent methyltransferase [Falsirhodobacter sp. alg1]
MTPLARHLARRIAQTGPLTLAEFMAECLLHPEHGYYTTRPPFGTAGDFITAPEISQMFGEMVGLCLAQHWLDSGGGAFTLAELGPGRGTLMADILRATRNVPGFHDAADVVLVEASPRLRAEQADRVPTARHVEGVDALPDGRLWLVANEFFDALPIRQFQRDGSGWRERMVGLEGERLSFGLSPRVDMPELVAAEADTIEICPQAPAIMQAIASRVAKGGMALILDYGGWGTAGDTFQAMAKHEFTDPLEAPGLADLTAHVDFRALAAAAAPCAVGYTTQGRFLTALGIGARAERLAGGLTGAARENHLLAFRRLTEADQMGELFKVLGLTGPFSHPPAGFT